MEAVNHTELPFDEIVESRMLPGDIPDGGLVACRIMQDGWEIGTWIEAGWEGAGPIAQKILAVNDLLEACKNLLNTCAVNLDDQEEADLEVYAQARAAITKAEGQS